MIEITKAGQMVDRLGGYSGVGSGEKKVYAGYSTVESTVGAQIPDEAVAPDFLERVRAGEIAGAKYVAGGEDQAFDAGGIPVPSTEDEESVSETDAQLETAKRRITELEEELATAKQDASDDAQRAADRIAELEDQLEEATSDSEDASVGAPAAGGEGGATSDQGSEQAYVDQEGYDPNDYTQPQVLDYLKHASPDEVKRVKAAEKQGQDRQQIGAFEASE